jgi:lauroyl/myristoyl acyltransferase
VSTFLSDNRHGRPHTERWAYRHLYTDRIFSLTTAAFPICGRKIFHAVSRSVAAFYEHTQAGVSETVLDNLRLLEPSADRSTVRELFRNYATCISDYVAVGAMSSDAAHSLCGEFVGREHIESAAGEGGAILATGHFGFFEFGAVVLQHIGIPVSVATLPEPTGSLTAWRAAWRARWGAETIAVGMDPFSSLAVGRALGAGRSVALLADRPQPGHGIGVDVPGGRTLFSTTPAVLSVVSGRPIVPVTVRLLRDGGYRVAALPPIRAGKPGRNEREAVIADCTRRLSDSLLGEILKAPAQWFQFVPVRCGEE